LKQIINAGAYGWCHPHWHGVFYPDDLPAAEDEDWRLSYYSNEFSAVLVPCDYWQTGAVLDCQHWLDDVHDDFQFFVECHASMLAFLSLAELQACFESLQPQLTALVFMGGDSQAVSLFTPLIEALKVAVIELRPSESAVNGEGWQAGGSPATNLVLLDNHLQDLKVARKVVDNIVEPLLTSDQSAGQNQLANPVITTIIVSHSQLQAENLTNFSKMLAIMGY